jgi:hypothetical protein
VVSVLCGVGVLGGVLVGDRPGTEVLLLHEVLDDAWVACVLGGCGLVVKLVDLFLVRGRFAQVLGGEIPFHHQILLIVVLGEVLVDIRHGVLGSRIMLVPDDGLDPDGHMSCSCST